MWEWVGKRVKVILVISVFGFYEYMDINVRESGSGTKMVLYNYRGFSRSHAKVIAETL